MSQQEPDTVDKQQVRGHTPGIGRDEGRSFFSSLPDLTDFLLTTLSIIGLPNRESDDHNHWNLAEPESC